LCKSKTEKSLSQSFIANHALLNDSLAIINNGAAYYFVVFIFNKLFSISVLSLLMLLFHHRENGEALTFVNLNYFWLSPRHSAG